MNHSAAVDDDALPAPRRADEAAVAAAVPKTLYSFHPFAACPMCGAEPAQFEFQGLRLNGRQGLRPRRKAGVAVSVVACRRCRTVLAHPQPRPQHVTDHYGMTPEEYWDAGRLEIDAVFEQNFRIYGARAHQLLGGGPGLRALDVGSGIGRTMHMLRGIGFEVVGVEPDAAFRARGLERFGFPAEAVVLSTIEDAEFERESFDYVCFGACLEHLYRPDEAIERTLRWLRPGGIIYAEVPFRDHLVTRVVNTLYKLIAPGFTVSTSPMHSPYHLYEFAPESFLHHGARAGYTVLQTEVQTTGHVWHFPRAAWPLMNAIMRRSHTGIQLHVWLRKTADPT
jgi:SAM-dependent methyltransferase